MKTTIRLTTATSLLALFFITINPVQAAPMICSTGSGGPYATFSLSNAADAACFPGLNDTNSIDSAFSLFGMTGWMLSDKNGDSSAGDPISFLNAPINGNKSGGWSIDTLAGLDNIVITLKAGRGFGAFLLDLTVSDPLSGTWSSSKGLSHASIYYKGTPSKVPEPPIILLIALGLLGLGFARRRKA